ncbi:MAG: hypothetical protein WCN88_03955 [Candidatus Falkowbacteria bacterium]
MFSYRSILKQALSIAWKNKYLWFFGLFASLAVAGGSMEYQFVTQSLTSGIVDGTYQSLSGLLALSYLVQQVWLGFVDLFSQNIIIIINTVTILLLTLTLIAVFIWLAISSQAALVDNVKKILTPKKKLSVASIREGLTTGSRHFWSVLGLNILIKILTGFAFFIVSLPLLFLVISDDSTFVVAYTILFVIFVPIAVSLSLIVKYAISCRVLENKTVLESLKFAVKLFKKNWLISLEIALILFLVSFLASLGILLAISIIFFPLLWMGIVFSINWLIFIMLFLCLVAAATFGSLYTTFQIATWTDLYLRLKDNKGTAKLERLFQKK